METFFGLLILLALLWLVVGLIKPSWALRWGRKRTRLRVVGWFMLVSLTLCIHIAIFTTKPGQTPSSAEQAAQTPTSDAIKQAAAEAEEGRKQAEANRERINRETEASLAALSARKEEAAPAVTDSVQRAKDEIKAKVRAFEKELLGYDAVSSMYMENAKAMTKQLGKGAGLGDLYAALKQARQYAQAGANAVLQLRVPDGLPKPVSATLEDAKEASWQMMLGRREALEAFMDWVDNRKPSAQAKLQEQSVFSTMQAAKSVEYLLQAKTAAGFTDAEIFGEAKKVDVPMPKEKPAKSKKGK